ncbi:MAG: hypothetical protein A2664_02560 [Candidatus Taylorbacteria bacterium RIFCSPHIGHO2_01_FULL_46_22b]|uniref:Co-chaperonin GroES n=1 Tax=Candidatus Taylorbacteria bacterium RIFCSPHIGHO2_01_FULL_46_22b TaxID=1802301 RepID=A0A1G2M351_9BACT|nr:MAG: hypothetical protein A2664_02560 [Candidatus Taylorbacteria bacterium RIFCSPHIGHO2_01_FULL_46_22b]
MKKTNTKKPSFNVKPLGDRVLVREIEMTDGSQTKSGIIIPETVHDDKGSKKGTVVAVGAGRREDGKVIPVGVSIGDTVLFQWGDMIKIDGVEYTIVSESNIIAIIK